MHASHDISSDTEWASRHGKSPLDNHGKNSMLMYQLFRIDATVKQQFHSSDTGLSPLRERFLRLAPAEGWSRSDRPGPDDASPAEARMKRSFNTLVMISAVVAAVAALTWIVPGGVYDRVLKEGRTLIVPGSFHGVPGNPQGLGDLLRAPVVGFIAAAHIIAFLFVIGGTFMILQQTGAVTAGIRQLSVTFARTPRLQRFFIPVTMTVFSLGGGIFGMCEETMPFVIIFIPLARSLGYDSIVGTAIPFLGAAAGFAGSMLNPFTVGIAQGIAELPLYSGVGFRVVVWVLSTIAMTAFVMRYGARIRRDPALSVVGDIDRARAGMTEDATSPSESLSRPHKAVLGLFAAAIVFLVYGILAYHWYINEIAALFLGLGIASGIVGRLRVTEITDAFRNGAKDMVGVALIIGCARAILVIAEDGRILDVMLSSLAGVITQLHPVFAAQAMFVVQGIVNFFVHSGSGQAALTMPVMAPLADVVGLSRQTAVLAFQFGEGWINPILPTSGVTMGVLGLAGIPWERWFRWMLPVQIFFFLLAMLLLAVATLINYQ